MIRRHVALKRCCEAHKVKYRYRTQSFVVKFEKSRICILKRYTSLILRTIIEIVTTGKQPVEANRHEESPHSLRGAGNRAYAQADSSMPWTRTSSYRRSSGTGRGLDQEQEEFTDVLKLEATVAALSSQTNTSSNTEIEEKLKEPEEKIEKDKLDTQALQERNQDVIRNKNQRIASLNEELIELKEDKTQDNDDSSEQQERLKELQENYDTSMADNKVFQSHR